MVNCDFCGKEIKRHIFCSASCKVRYHRGDKKIIEIPGAIKTVEELKNKISEDKITNVIDNHLSKHLSRCSICTMLKENVHPVLYLQDGEKTTDDMCGDCEKKIPEEMKLERRVISNFTFNHGSTLNSYFNPVPKPVKKKRK